MNGRVRSLDSVPRYRQQRTPQAAPPVLPAAAAPAPTHEHYGLTLSESIGRIPTIGIDSGAMPGTRPDHRYG